MLRSVFVPAVGRTFKFGRIPSKNEAKRKFRYYTFGPATPPPPTAVDYSAAASKTLSNIYGNDQLGDCVIAGGFHVRGITSANAGSESSFTSQQVIHDYSAIGGYVPGNSNTDRGCDLQTAMNYWQQAGFPDGVKLAGWLAVDPMNQQECMTALWLFENLYMGLGLPDQWINNVNSMQNGFVWDVAGSPDPMNGHCIMACGGSSQGLEVSTWGMKGTLTWRAVQSYLTARAGGELYVLLSPDMVSKAQQKAPNGFDWEQLKADFTQMGGTVVDPNPVNPVVPPIWQGFVNFIEGLLKQWGPAILPMIKQWLEVLPLPAVVVQIIEALLDQVLTKNRPQIQYKVHN